MRSKFSSLIRLPIDSEIVRLRNVSVGTTVNELKDQLELLVGLPAKIFRLEDICGKTIDESALRFVRNSLGVSCIIGENRWVVLSTLDQMTSHTGDNTILKLRVDDDFTRDVYTSLKTGHDEIVSSQSLKDPFTVLFIASFFGRERACEHALHQGADIHDATRYGNTALHAAMSQDRVNTALLLCHHGASITTMNNSGETPLRTAARVGAKACERTTRLTQWQRKAASVNLHSEKEPVAPTASQPPPKDLNFYRMQSQSSDTKVTQISSLLTQPLENNSHKYERATPTTQGETECANITRQPGDPTADTKRVRVSTAKPRPQTGIGADQAKSQKRVKSAPPLIYRNQRECVARKKNQPEETIKQNKHNFLRMSRPQYLQYIKSSTGIVEVDYFADLYPTEDTSDDKEDEDFSLRPKTHSKVANDKAFRRWCEKKEAEEAAKPKESIFHEKHSSQLVGELLLIGDTTSGSVEKENPEKYLYAFQRYKKHNKRSKSAQPIPTPVIIQRQHAKSATKTRVRFVLDETETIQQSQPHTNPVCKTRPSISTSKPELYEDWLARKEEEITYEPAAQETTSVTQKLKKKIDYKTWLDEANKRLTKSLVHKRKEEAHQKHMDAWIKEVKEDADPFGYWKRKKAEQWKQQREVNKKKAQETDKAKLKRKQEAKRVYEDWIRRKEEKLLQEEAERLEAIREA